MFRRCSIKFVLVANIHHAAGNSVYKVLVAYNCGIICNDLGVEAYQFYTSYLPLFKTV